MTLALLLFMCAAVQEPQSPQDTVRGMKVPEGFRVQLFAGEPDVVQPVSFCIDDRGRLWVVEMLSYPKWDPRDRVVVLEDSDGDGVFDKRTVFFEGLTFATGIEVGFGGVYVIAPPKFLFIPDKDGDLKPDGAPEVLLDGFGLQGGHNIANGFTWGPDGWLYAGHGRTSISDVGKPGCRPDERIHYDGGLWRWHPTRRVFEAWCDGTTNPWGVAFDDYGQTFMCTCVDVHLYHAVQGGKFEPWRGRESSRYAYKRIPSIADHKHWAGNSIDGSRGGKADTMAAGGGHAHCGMMCYLGDSFPPEYRGRLFMNNLHGHRVNQDIPKRVGSGFTASHGADFMISSDPMHTGLLLQYGPDGGVFVSDWYDKGECHTRTPDGGTGRIYKVTYKDTPKAVVDLAARTDAELVAFQLHKNDWYVTHARRLLQERGPKPEIHAALLKIFEENPDVTRRLRALWALHVTGGLTDERRRKALEDPSEYVRAWAIQLEMETRTQPLPEFVRMAKEDPSPVVRLYLASAAPRMSLQDRWEILRGLASHDEDAKDPNLPLLIWYAAEPMAEEDGARAIAFVADAKIPLLREFMARRLAGVAPSTPPVPEGLTGTIAYTSTAPQGWDLFVRDIATGKERRLTDSAALDYGAVFSPDGSRIAFVSERDGNPELYSILADGSDLRRLTRNPALDHHPAWSPDAQQIIFASTRTGTSALYLMRSDGKSVERLSPAEAVDFSPAWSWWGDLVAFSSGGDLWVMKPDGSERRRVIADGGWPTFAAGSRTIYFQSRRDGAWGIWRVNADGSGLKRVTPLGVETWTPRAIRANLLAVTTKEDGGRAQLATIDLDTGAMQMRSSDPADHWNPCLSPDGKTLVYHRIATGFVPPAVEDRGFLYPGLRLVRVAGRFPAVAPDGLRVAVTDPLGKRIEVLGLDGSRSTIFEGKGAGAPAWPRQGTAFAFSGVGIQLIPDKGLEARVLGDTTPKDMFPSFSPDAKELVYTSMQGKSMSLMILKADGTGIRRVTDGALDGMPDWSPSGDAIVFPSDRGGVGGLWLVKPDGTGLRRLIDGVNLNSCPRFSPDGRWVVFVSKRAGATFEDMGYPLRSEDELFAVRVDASGLVRLTHNGFHDAMPSWGPSAKDNGGR